MRVQIISGVAAAVMTLGSAAAFAKREPPLNWQFNGPGQTGPSAANHVHGLGMVLAQSGPTLSDGSGPGYLKRQKQLLDEPGYSVGTSAAHVADGSSSGYEKQQQQLVNGPGYSVGTSAAHIGDGSSPGYLKQQKQILDEPGYNVGTGAAHVADNSNSGNRKTQR